MSKVVQRKDVTFSMKAYCGGKFVDGGRENYDVGSLVMEGRKWLSPYLQ
jgi:hypothetical protein